MRVQFDPRWQLIAWGRWPSKALVESWPEPLKSNHQNLVWRWLYIWPLAISWKPNKEVKL